MDRKVLGRGISALIPEHERESNEKIAYLKLEQVRPNPLQPREDFDSQNLEDLTQSIREKGVIQPVLVRQVGEYYELIAGERRFRAAQALGLPEIPAIIKEAGELDSLELSLIENMQRQNLNPIEEAKACQYLIDKYQFTQDKVSEVLGKARASVSNALRLLKLPLEIQEEMKKGRISFGHGRALLEVEDENKQRWLVQKVISSSLSVRELENLIKAHRPRGTKQSPGLKDSKDPHISAIEENLQHELGTKVRIIKKKKRGHITIEFYSQEDLDRIINKIKGGVAV